MHMVCIGEGARRGSHNNVAKLLSMFLCNQQVRVHVCVRASERASSCLHTTSNRLDRDRTRGAHKSEHEFHKRAPCVVCLLLFFS